MQPPPVAGGPLTRESARALVRWYLQGKGATSTEGLDAEGRGGAMLSEAQLYFEHLEAKQALECSALIYRFREEPKPGVVDGFRAEATEGTDAGGGEVAYEADSRCLYLRHTYTQVPTGAEFSRDMDRLMKASLVWGRDVLDRVAHRVFGT
ncbi:hypothetical protein KRR26_31880 [Corallococcus sp. M34]|nr:hypothetical protein [Citreicoccus inhibens]